MRVVLFVLLVTLVVSVHAADAPVPAAQQLTLQQVQQQMSVTIKKEVSDSEKRISDNVDANFKYLDERISSMIKTALLRLIAGLLGGMTLVLVGYAWLLTYVTRKYTTVYQRNMLKSKLDKAVKSGRVLMPGQQQNENIVTNPAYAQSGAADQYYPRTTHPFYYEPIFKEASFFGSPAPAGASVGGGYAPVPPQEIPPQYEEPKRSKGKVMTVIMLFVLLVLVAAFVLRRMGVF